VSEVLEAARFALRTRFDTPSILGIEIVGKQRPIQLTGFENTLKQCGQRKSRMGRTMKITLQPRNFNCSRRSEQKVHLYGLGGFGDTAVACENLFERCR
jgi:hypothetical protein